MPPVSLLQNIPAVINGVRRGDTEAVAGALDAIGQSIQDMTDALKLMHGKVSVCSIFKVIFKVYTVILTDALFVKCMWILQSSMAL